MEVLVVVAALFVYGQEELLQCELDTCKTRIHAR